MKNRSAQSAKPVRHPARAVAFTLVELLVIVAIIGVLLASGVPAIRNMIYTSSGSLAESQLHFGLGAARDLAIRSAGGDTAAVFTFEPGNRLSIIPMVYVGQILDTRDPDQPLGAAAPTCYRDVFAPSALAEPVQLPAGWMVRGFAAPGTVFADGMNAESPPVMVKSNGWYYEQPATAKGNRRLNLGTDQIANGLANRGNWVFPETGFYDPSVTERGMVGSRPNNRNTFMVRFEAGTGRIVGANPTPVIVLLPRVQIDLNEPNSLASQRVNWTPNQRSDWRRVDHTDNLAGWARAVCKMPDSVDAAALIGCRSTDSALASSVNIVGLYDESRMASAIGARGLNRQTGTIYGGAITGLNTATEVPKAPNIDLTLWSGSTTVAGAGADPNRAERVQMLINNWMINALRYSDVVATDPATSINSDARIFTVDSYLGSVSEAK